MNFDTEAAMIESTNSLDTEPVPAPDGDGTALAQPDSPTRIPARRRKADADAAMVTPVTLDLSNRVIEHFQSAGDEWRGLINESLNLIVNRHVSREAKKRARLRARSAVKRRPPLAPA